MYSLSGQTVEADRDIGCPLGPFTLGMNLMVGSWVLLLQDVKASKAAKAAEGPGRLKAVFSSQ